MHLRDLAAAGEALQMVGRMSSVDCFDYLADHGEEPPADEREPDQLRAALPALTDHVSVYVGLVKPPDKPSESHLIIAEAYDSNNKLIASAVTEGVEQPEQLLPAGVSAHHYSLKPSERIRLQQAELVIWVGPNHETFLRALLHNRRHTLSLDNLPQGVVVFDGSYHGRTNLTLAMTSKFALFKKGYGPFAPEVYRFPFPNLYRRPGGVSAEGA